MPLLDTLSVPLVRALKNANSTAVDWASLDTTTQITTSDGLWPAGHGGLLAPNRVFVAPFADGPAGSNFSMRVYGYRVIGPPDAAGAVWIPFLIAELACTTSNRAGPTSDLPSTPPINLLSNERLCDTLTLTQGVVGNNGFAGGVINSTGPGTDLVAYALIDLMGCRYYFFDFKATDPNLGMNCLQSRA